MFFIGSTSTERERDWICLCVGGLMDLRKKKKYITIKKRIIRNDPLDSLTIKKKKSTTKLS